MDLEMNTISKEYTTIREFCSREVIEFGAVCLNEGLEEIGEFQCYVKPEYNTSITHHITKITGIQTSQVENAETFRSALERFIDWCGSDFEIYSWSESDPIQLQQEIELKGIQRTEKIDRLFCNWTDLQKMYDEFMFCERQIGLKMAVSNAGIEFKGREHGAVTDARAAADLYREMKTGSTLKRIRGTLESGKKPLGTCLGDLFEGVFASCV